MKRVVVVSAQLDTTFEDWDIAERIRDFIETEFFDSNNIVVTILNNTESSVYGRKAGTNGEGRQGIRVDGQGETT